MEKLYENDRFEFTLLIKEGDGASGARILRTKKADGETTVLFDYGWPEQLTVEVTNEDAVLREDGVLCWQLHVTAHHVKGVIQGEFTETEWFELENPFGSADEMICRTVCSSFFILSLSFRHFTGTVTAAPFSSSKAPGDTPVESSIFFSTRSASAPVSSTGE